MLMYNEQELKEAIIRHMESVKLTSWGSCVSKGNIVLKVSQKLGINESQEYLLEKAFDKLVVEGKIRSNFNTYNERGQVTEYRMMATEEKFYLNQNS